MIPQDELERQLTAMKASLSDHSRRLVALEGQTVGKAPGTAMLPHVDINGEHGDPTVKFDPRDWKGNSLKGLPMSQCPPNALRMLSKALMYFADKNQAAGKVTSTGKPAHVYDRLDAARAIAWAERIEQSETTGQFKPQKSKAVQTPMVDEFDGSDPF